MKLIFGLGNPEPEYTNTRHNIGKDILNQYIDRNFNDSKWKRKDDWFCEYFDLGNEAIAVKPTKNMNESGITISKITNFYKVRPTDILIIYDELDLIVGEYKIAHAKGSRIHNGIISIKNHLNSENFWHLRIGVRDEEIPGSVQKTGRDPAKYVLSQFSTSDRKKISEMAENFLFTEINNWINDSSK